MRNLNSIIHRRLVSVADAHYGVNMVDGAFLLKLLGDVVTDLSIANDGDQGLFASYEEVQFLAPVFAGDIVEASGEYLSKGTRSRQLRLKVDIVARSTPEVSASAAELLPKPIPALSALGVVVIPK